MRIRPAAPADAPSLYALVQRAYEGYVALVGRRPAPMDEDYSDVIARAIVLVAQDEAGIAGLIVLSDEGDHLLIENVAIDPERQHAGLGRTLMARAEEVALERALPELRLYTNAAMERNLRLYPELGYTETGRRRGSGFDRVYFAKRLQADGRGGGTPPPHARPTAW